MNGWQIRRSIISALNHIKSAKSLDNIVDAIVNDAKLRHNSQSKIDKFINKILPQIVDV